MKKKTFNHSYLNLKDNTKLCFFSSNQSKNKLGIIIQQNRRSIKNRAAELSSATGEANMSDAHERLHIVK